MDKFNKIREVEEKIDKALQIINGAVVEYEDATKPKWDTIGLRPSGNDAVAILLQFFACKRLTDLQKHIPNLFDRKIFMEGVIEPSISYKELRQFLKAIGLFVDLNSKFGIRPGGLIGAKTPKDLAELLHADSISDAIFGLISATKKIKSIVFREVHKEHHFKKDDQKRLHLNIEQLLYRNIYAFIISTLTWEELQEHDEYMDDLLDDGVHTFDDTVNTINEYLLGWGLNSKLYFRRDGQLGSPAINELGSSKKEDLKFIRLRLDKFKKKELFDIFSTLDFSPSNFTRHEFDKISVGFLDSYLTLETSPADSQKIRRPSLGEQDKLRDDTRVLKLTLQLLNIKKNDSILLRGCSYLNYVFENTYLNDNVSSLVLNPDPTSKEIDKFLENPNFSNQLQIILNDNSIINKLRLLLLGLPISLIHKNNNLNEELGYSQQNSELVVAMKGTDHLYSVRSILDSKYESQADIVLFQFPDEGGGLNFPKYVYESALGFTKKGIRGNRILLSQASPTEANILSSISQLVPSKGRMGIIVHDKFLNNKRNKTLRKLLINKDLIEAIVEINFNRYRRNIKKENQTIIILNLDKRTETKHKYLIASIDIDERETVILWGSPEEKKDKVAGLWDRNFEWLLESYTKFPHIHKFETADYRSNVVDIDDFRFNDYDLSAGRYKKVLLDAYKKISNSGTHPLGEICEIVNGVNLPTNKQITISSENLLKIEKKAPIVRPGNLSTNYLDPELLIGEQSSYNFYDTSNLKNPSYQKGIITEQSILVKLTGHDLKPTKFDPNKELYADEILNNSSLRNIIFINQNIAAIKIKKEYKGKIDFDYLYCVIVETISLLHSLRNIGKTQQGTSISELELMGIPIPEKIEEQHLKVREIKLSLIEEEEKRRRLKEKGQDSIELKDKAEFELSSFINHEGGRKIQRMNTKLMALQDFIEKHGLGEEPLQAPFPGQETLKVTKAIKEALDSSKQLHDLLANISDFCKGEIKPEDLVPVDIERVFKENILTLQDGSFSIHFSYKGNNKIILLEETWFVGSMDNLISNAKIHGFMESNDENIIEFEISDKNLGIIIDYKNNGKPLPEDINEEIYLRLGKKGHDSPGIGMGGAYINKMLEAHRAEFTIIRKNTEGVHFQFYFPNNFNSD